MYAKMDFSSRKNWEDASVDSAVSFSSTYSSFWTVHSTAVGGHNGREAPTLSACKTSKLPNSEVVEGTASDCGTWLQLDQDPWGYSLIHDEEYSSQTFLVPCQHTSTTAMEWESWPEEEYEEEDAGDMEDAEGTEDAGSTDDETETASDSASAESDCESEGSTSGSDCSEDRKEDATQDEEELSLCHYCREWDYALQWFESDSLLKKGWACERCSSLDYDELLQQANDCMRR